MVGAWSGPALLTSLRCSLSTWDPPLALFWSLSQTLLSSPACVAVTLFPQEEWLSLTTHSLLKQAARVASSPTERLVWGVKAEPARD